VEKDFVYESVAKEIRVSLFKRELLEKFEAVLLL